MFKNCIFIFQARILSRPKTFTSFSVIKPIHKRQLKVIVDGRSTYQFVQPSQSTSECWNCNSRNFQSNLFICGSCNHLKDPSEGILSMNFFKLFELDLQYNIDMKELTQRYKDLQKSFHPDKFYTLRNPKTIKFSETYSAYINEAFSSLKDDLIRGEYLLDILSGGKKDELIQGFTQSEQFLSNSMMIRMEIEEASSEEELKVLKESLEASKNELIQQVDRLLQQNEYNLAAKSLIEMRYNQSALEAILQKTEQKSLIK